MALVLDGSTGIVSANIADGTISANDLASGAITASAMPAGSVLQVVNQVLNGTSAFSTTSSTFTDVISASITPSSASSKILITSHITGISNYGGTVTGQTQLVRNSTELTGVDGYIFLDSSGSAVGGTGITYLDSPATTSSVTYKIQGRRSGGSGTFQLINYTASTFYTATTLTLMEIAA